MTKIEITDEEAKIFTNIQKWFHLLNMLERYKVYGFNSTDLIIHFDSQGVISKVERVEHLRP